MNNVKVIYIAITFVSVWSCAMVGMRSGYTDWDVNGNGQLNRYEFVRGYQKSNYFFRWNKLKNISEPQFYLAVYNALDQDKDSLLTCQEFDAKIGYFYSENFTENCHTWDDDNDNRLTKEEFGNHAEQTRLFSMWDVSGNKRISEKEMATGMFSISDLDNSGSINPLEFNVWTMNRY